MADKDSGGWEFSAGFFIGGLVGGLLGAVAALLIAPQAGEDTRALLREKGIELKERAEDASFDARRKAEDAAAQARLRAEDAAAQARDRASMVRESAKLTLDEKVSQVKDAIDTGKQAADRKKDEMMHNLDAEKGSKPMPGKEG